MTDPGTEAGTPGEAIASPPTAFGSGLVALDVIVSGIRGKPPALLAGGTCGNVLTILSYLGWRTFPLARLNGDRASVRLQADLRRWKVRLDFAHLDPPGSTAMVVQRIHRDGDGLPFHTFSWNCPSCSARLPWYRPVHKAAARAVASQMGESNVFFFDRVSRGTLLLAEESARRGAIVVFEPSGFGDIGLFREALRLSHILKYSRDRMGQLDEVGPIQGPLLEIETLGRWGLCYRTRLGHSTDQDWIRVDAYTTGRFKDAAGAGDWCTAGLLHKVGKCGIKGLQDLSSDHLADAISFGQALAVWNCAFEGARGGMYQVSQEMFHSQIACILSGKKWEAGEETLFQEVGEEPVSPICPACPPSP